MLYKNRKGSHSDLPWRREDALTDGAPRYMWSEDDAFGRCGAATTLPSGKEAPCACMAKYTETGECVECTAKALWRKALSNPDELPMTSDDAERLGLNYTLSPVPCREGPHLRTFRVNGDGESCTTCSDALPPRQVAEGKGLPTYIPKGKCKLCKTKSPRHTDTGRCIKCGIEKGPVETSPRQAARDAGETRYMPEAICMSCGEQALRSVHNGACDGCKAHAKTLKALSPRQIAMRAGEVKFMPEDPCPLCNTRALKHITNGRCDGCRDMAKAARSLGSPSQRQRAVNQGEAKYVPETSCPKCGTRALRRVDNGRCDGCEAKIKDVVPTSRAAAKRAGQVKYKPLEVCLSCGTKSLRSVKDDTCEGCTALIDEARKSLATSIQVNEATRTAMDTMPSGQVISMEVAQSCGFDAFRPTGGKWLHVETLAEIRA